MGNLIQYSSYPRLPILPKTLKLKEQLLIKLTGKIGKIKIESKIPYPPRYYWDG